MTPTGRIGPSQPPMQNIPIHTEEGDQIRAVLLAALRDKPKE
jgi:DNA polymerase I-like protein with 3'-5' exonuclease and polymerase domains